MCQDHRMGIRLEVQPNSNSDIFAGRVLLLCLNLVGCHHHSVGVVVAKVGVHRRKIGALLLLLIAEPKDKVLPHAATKRLAKILVPGWRAESAHAVLDRAYEEASAAFRSLHDLGFWFDPALSREVVHAIVGLEGVARMQALTTD